LTGRVCDALPSSHFAVAAKRAGVDALVVTGAASERSILLIDGTDRDEPQVHWQPAGSLWGLSAGEAEAQWIANNNRQREHPRLEYLEPSGQRACHCRLAARLRDSLLGSRERNASI